MIPSDRFNKVRQEGFRHEERAIEIDIDHPVNF